MNAGITDGERTECRQLRRRYGGPEELLIRELPIPEPTRTRNNPSQSVRSESRRDLYEERGMGRCCAGEWHRMRWHCEGRFGRQILDSLAMVRRGGRVCLAGFLGGLSPITSFNPLLQLPSGVHFSFFGSFMFGQPQFPLSEVPWQQIIDRAASGVYQAKPAKVFRFEEIQEARRLIESNQANGKLVILA
jgi:threonine dehydrogenase-like Zn-dependent dehydrogenase